MQIVGVTSAALRKFPARMDAQVGRLLCPVGHHVAKRLGWQGAGFVAGVVETRKLDPNKLPAAFMVGGIARVAEIQFGFMWIMLVDLHPAGRRMVVNP